MKELPRWLVARAIRNYQSVNDLNARAREGWPSIVVHPLLFAVKMVLGLSIGSVSLFADAIHTLADGAPPLCWSSASRWPVSRRIGNTASATAERFTEMRTIIKGEPSYAHRPAVDEGEAGTP